MQWLYSTNAKEIGTLYLIFAIFAGMFVLAINLTISLNYKEIIYLKIIKLIKVKIIIFKKLKYAVLLLILRDFKQEYLFKFNWSLKILIFLLMINFIDNLIHYHYNLELIMISKLTAINFTFTTQRKFSFF